jgi:hypothetical protein
MSAWLAFAIGIPVGAIVLALVLAFLSGGSRDHPCADDQYGVDL